jgi:AraC-like DNA-binding protein
MGNDKARGSGAAYGFTSASHFRRVFRSTYGMPPAEFRAAYTAAGVLGAEPT